MKFLSNRLFNQQNRIVLILLFLLILAILLRLPSIPQTFDNDSGAIAYHARLILSGEPLYSSHHPGHHLPAVYYLYTFIFWVFGDHYQSVKIFLILWVWLNSILIFFIGKKLQNVKTGLIAAFFFTILSSSSYLLGDTGEIELFANLPITLVIYLWVFRNRINSANITFFLIGIFSAFAILFKPNYITSLPAVLLGLLITNFFFKRSSIIIFIKQLLSIIIGLLLVFIFCFSFFYISNSSEGLLQVFLLGSKYIGSSSAAPAINIILVGPILLARANMGFAIIGLFSMFHLGYRSIKTFRSNTDFSIEILVILFWLIISILSAGISRLPFPHYSLLLLPAGSILISFEISQILDTSANSKIFSIQHLIGFGLILVIIINTIKIESSYFSGYLQYQSNKISLNDFIRYHTSMGPDRSDANEIVNYIKNHTTRRDKLFLWTDEVEIYYLSDRLSSSNNLWPAEIDKLGSTERVFFQKPTYIIVGRTLQTESNTYGLVPPQWLKSHLTSSFHLEEIIRNYYIYRKNGS